jgi:processive 1,2-diacylglycerol beta-glucosyltransferase
VAAGRVRILILTASIGEGHDLPARVLAEGIRAEAPGAEIETIDTLQVMGGLVRRVIMDSSHFHSKLGSRIFDLIHRLITDVPPTRWLASALGELITGRRLQRAVEAARADVVVSTYPGATEVLGRLRRRGRLKVPLVSAITDLAALRYWAHPGVDLHLITHPESAEEVAEIAPGSRILAVRGLTDERFYEPREAADARRDLGLPPDGPVILVSGGGWAIGDLEGAAEEALGLPGATVVCLCGRNEELRSALADHFRKEPRVRMEGFTERMPDWFAAADLLVHSSAGLTVLEAIMRGAGVVSYGWGFGHVRVNNEAFARHGLAEVANSRAQLGKAMQRALARHPEPDPSFAALPSAASAVLDLTSFGLTDGEPGDRG